MRTLAFLLLCALTLAAGEHTGRRAPGFALPDANMKLYDLADYRGKVLILEFMQTDCPHCVTFAPVLKQVQEKYGNKVAILAVANTPHDSADSVERYRDANKVSYPVVFDQGQMEYSYIKKLSIENPYVFVIDGNGVIRDDFGYGPFTKDMFEGKGLFTTIDRILSSNSSMAPSKK